MSTTGAFRERLHEAWIESRRTPAAPSSRRSGVMLGVASVLGGFSISDSQRQQTERIFARIGGIDKLNVLPTDTVYQGTPERAAATPTSACAWRTPTDGGRIPTRQGGQRHQRAEAGAGPGALGVRRPGARRQRHRRRLRALNGYEIEQGRGFSAHDFATGAPVAILGSEAASVFFPTGDIVGKPLRIGDVPVTVIGVFREKNFRFREGQQNIFAWRNRIVAVPVAARRGAHGRRPLPPPGPRHLPRPRPQGDGRLLQGARARCVTANHRLQDDFRLDDVGKRLQRQLSQGDVYNIIFMLSGVLALIGGGMVNVNIQLASLKERVREVGVKMAIGASGREIFKSFMTEALLLTLLGQRRRLPHRHRLLLDDHQIDRHPAVAGAAELRLGHPDGPRLRLPVRALSGRQGQPAVADGGAAL